MGRVTIMISVVMFGGWWSGHVHSSNGYLFLARCLGRIFFVERELNFILDFKDGAYASWTYSCQCWYWGVFFLQSRELTCTSKQYMIPAI